MSQEVIRRPVTAEARIPSQVSPCGTCSEQSGTGRGLFLSKYFGFSPVIINAPTLRTHHLNFTLTRRTNGRNLGTFERAILFRKSGRIG